METWPASPQFTGRYRVPDLIPRLKPGELRAVFIGESPHRDEVKPESVEERSPFRGVAGREWWQELLEFVKDPSAWGETRRVPPRAELLNLCQELRVAVMNAVQFPIDPKITLHQGDTCTPRDQLGFEKAAGEWGYKAVSKKPDSNPVGIAIADLSRRLKPFAEAGVQIVCLGNDSRWFVERALAEHPVAMAKLQTIPHPSSWWRNTAYRAKAVGVLKQVLR